MSKDTYKNAISALDFITAVCHKMVPIIEEKVLADLNIDSFKNFATYMTSLAMITTQDNVVHYVSKALYAGKPSSKNAKKVEENIQGFIQQMPTILTVLKHFGGTANFQKKEEITNLSDAVSVIETAVEELEKRDYPAILQLHQKIPVESKEKETAEEKTETTEEKEKEEKEKEEKDEEHTASGKNKKHKKGAFETLAEKVEQELITGGYESFTQGKLCEVKIGGLEEAIKIGGFRSDDNFRTKVVQYELLNENCGCHGSEQVPDQKNLLLWNTIEKMFTTPDPESLRELANMSTPALLAYFAKEAQLDGNLREQITYMQGPEAEKMVEYCAKRGQTLVAPAFGMEAGNGAKSLEEECAEVLAFVQNFLLAVNTSDTEILTNYAQERFEELNNLGETEMEAAVNAFYSNAQKFADSLNVVKERRIIKQKINTQCQEVQVFLQNRADVLEKVPKILRFSVDASMAPTAVAKYLLELQAALLPALREQETFYNQLAALLGALSKNIDILISPEIKTTCIRKAQFVLDLLLTGNILILILPERNKSTAQHVKTIQQTLHEVNETFEDINIPLYDSENGLLMENIQKIITHLV